ncbi:L,D-transpeptidase [Pseudonocardia petroleophila]|uniref:L,D-transpeptidase family protein n=1 Tax=Pseudonocardia petroleophila TaxID=37331 RepID=A0A7G7ML22_9PSEU|nr:L,D-transpeptidase family protein [Pseudonocardia petroleophila]QNG53483.1 L,D-transpeptidase family protein [Pseudonocardia petroleophila]
MVGGVALVLVVILGFTFLGSGPASTAGSDAPPVVDIAALPLADTYGVVEGAPVDPAAGVATDGIVVHPERQTPVHDAPEGAPIARVEPTQFGDVWFPVIAEQGDWVQILLPSKPFGSTGWVRSADMERATTPYRVEVHLGSLTMQLLREESVVGEWEIGIGAPDTPTPVGRTFILGAFTDPAQDFSPVILPLGAHSPTLDTFGGGPGTVAIHTWPTADGFGSAASNGCIRVPQDALDELVEVPLGTLVMIDQD